MMKNAKTIRIVLNSVLLLAIVALGVTVYQAGTREDKEPEQALEEQDMAAVEEGEEEEIPQVSAGTSEVEAQMGEEPESSEESTSVTEEELTQETAQNEAAAEIVEMEAQEAGLEVNFTEESLMQWPLSGELVLDYNMENTVYLPTLDQYQLNPAIAVKSEVGSPVMAAANGTITAVYEDAKTGLTVAMDLGNGYEAVYGQLKDLAAAEGQTVAQGSVLGYVNEPTKYYSTEGSNLYFAMRKDGAPIDPITYLP